MEVAEHPSNINRVPLGEEFCVVEILCTYNSSENQILVPIWILNQTVAMAILPRVLALALLTTLASARDQFQPMNCPANSRQYADESISYASASTIALLSSRVLSGGPYSVIAAAEPDTSRKFSCIKLTPTLNTFGIQYFEGGKAGVASLTWDPTAAEFKGTLPVGLMGASVANQEVKYTVTSYKDGVLMLKTCRNGFFSHFISTFVMADNSVDTTSLRESCLTESLQTLFRIDTWPKGLCR